MQMTPSLPGSPRITGLGLVVLIHLVIVWALVTGLMRGGMHKPLPPAVVALDPDKPVPPVPEPPLVPNLRLPTVDPLIVPAPLVPDIAQPPAQSTTVTLDTAASNAGASDGEGSAQAAAAQIPASATRGPVSPGSICTRMGRPELPPLNWSGDAVFKVVGTVKAGRVVDIAFASSQGGMDPRSRRALQAAISTAMRDSYECPGDHQFEQEFHFRIE